MIKKFLERALCAIIIVMIFIFGMHYSAPRQPVFIYPNPSEPVFVYPDITNNIKEVVDEIQKATVYIETDFWTGSGVLIDKERGIILTAGHIVEDCDFFRVAFNNGTVVYSWESYEEESVDVGFIKVDPNDVSHLNELRFANGYDIGDDVYICGCPFGEELVYSVTFGKISGVKRNIPFFGRTLMIQSDAQAWPGNSGGPVVNTEGKIVGIIVGGYSRFDGLSLIISVDACELSLKKYIAELELEKIMVEN